VSFETKELSGSLFKNNAKREGKQDADYTGRCKVGGVEFWINAWINTGKGGVKYMGLKFREIAAVSDSPPMDERKNPAEEPLNDEIPF
jgi:hypothetical protein